MHTMKNQLISFRKGDLSAPVLAIIVTIGIIAAGLLLMAWFWWFAPQAGKTGALQILGTPVVICNGTVTNVTISVKNIGSANITIRTIVAGNLTYTVSTTVGELDPGESKDISVSGPACPTNWIHTVDGVVITTAGTYATSFTVIRPPS